MSDTSGFYRIGPCGTFMRAGKFVYAPDYTLLRQEKDEYTYPTPGGWYWFETAAEARAHFNLPEDAEYLE